MNINKIEKDISNQIIAWIKRNPKATQGKIKDKIIQKIINRGYLKESWQIHYAKEKIMIFINKELGIDEEEEINFDYAGFWKRLIACVMTTQSFLP